MQGFHEVLIFFYGGAKSDKARFSACCINKVTPSVAAIPMRVLRLHARLRIVHAASRLACWQIRMGYARWASAYFFRGGLSILLTYLFL